MNIVKSNACNPNKSYYNFLDEIFNRSISDVVGSDFVATTPSVNITETKESYHLDLAAPGLQKSDFKLTIDRGVLTITATKEDKKEEGEEGKWTRKEFNYSSFSRSFNLSDTVDISHIEASYDHGILHVVLPKKEEAKIKDPVAIEIK